MLDLLRRNTRTFGIYFMFAAIIVVFGFTFGAISPDQACGQRPGVMAQADLVKVEDATVDTAMLFIAAAVSEEPPPPRSGKSDDIYRMTRYRNLGLIGPTSGGAFSRIGEDVHPVGLVKFVDDLVETKLVSHYARSLGMAVSDREMNLRLALFTSGFRDETTGRFDPNGLRNWLNRNQISATRFESFVRDEILREKVIQLLVGEVGITDAEIDAAYRISNDKVTIEAISVDTNSARALVPVSEQEVSEWLAENTEKLESEYDKRKATEFSTPKKWRLRGIRFDAPDPQLAADDDQREGLQAARDAVRGRASGVLADLKQAMAAPAPAADDEGDTAAPQSPAEVFASFAAEHSDDEATKSVGGQLKAGGYTEAELGRPPFGPAAKDAVLAASAGQTLDLVEVGGSFWILHVDAVDEARTDSLDDVRTALARKLIQEERAEVFKDSLADEVLAEAKKNPTAELAEIARLLNEKYGVSEAQGLQVRQVMAFPRLQEDQSPFIFSLGGRSPELVRAAFAASDKAPVLPEVFTIDPLGRKVIARFLSRSEPEALEDSEREEIRKAMVFERQRDLYRGWYEDLLAKKLASGAVKFTDAFERERKRAEESFVSSGGVLPMTASARPATEEATN